MRRHGAAWHEREFNKRWRDLMDYNSERARGLMHQPAWVARMARQQALYNELSQSGDRDALWTHDLDAIRNV